MTFEYKIDSEAGVIFMKFEGDMGEKEVEAMRAQIQSDPNNRPSLNHLIDFTTANVKFDSKGAFRLAEWARVIKPYRKSALVVGDAQYPFLKMYTGFAGDDLDAKIFEDMNSARQWLGLPEED